MFIILLKFADNKSSAGDFMDGHNQWVKQGFIDNVFLLAGSLTPGLGGSVIAHNTSLVKLQDRVNEDPFVRENIVTAEILEIDPKLTEERLSFLIDG